MLNGFYAQLFTAQSYRMEKLFIKKRLRLICTAKIYLLLQLTNMPELNIKQLPKKLRNMSINIFLIPFWYISIYLFGPSIYNSKDSILIASVCISYTIISAFLAYVTAFVLDKKPRKKKKRFHHGTIIMSFINQVSWLSTIILTGYLYPLLFNAERFNFYGFSLLYFIPTALFFIYGLNKSVNRDKKREQKEKKES